MADSKIQIAVEVVGADKANKQIQSLEESSVDLKEGVKGVGDGFKSVGDLVKAQGGIMGDAFGTLGDSVVAVTDSIFVFKEGMSTAGATGAKAWLGLLGPIAAVVGAVALAVDAYRQFSGSSQAAEDNMENMAAAASDTASRLEAMVEGGIELASESLREFIQVNEKARLAIEQVIKINEKRATSQLKVVEAEKGLKDAQESTLFTETRVALAKSELITAQKEYNRLLDEQTAKSREANKAQKEAYELEQLITTELQVYIDEYQSQIDLQKENIEKTIELTDAKNKDFLITQATNDIQKRATEQKLALIKAQKINDQLLKDGVITQRAYDEASKQIKKSLDEQNKSLKESNRDISLNNELLESNKNITKSTEEEKRKEIISTGLTISNEFEKRQKQFDREMTLLSREKESLIDLYSLKARIAQKTEEDIKTAALLAYESRRRARDKSQSTYQEEISTTRQMSEAFTYMVNRKIEMEQKLLDKKREFDLKNIKQSGLTQQQIEEDYKYHSNKLLEMAKYRSAIELTEGYKKLAAEFQSFNAHKDDLTRANEISSNQIRDIKKSASLEELKDSEDTEYNRIQILKLSNEQQKEILQQNYEQAKKNLEGKNKLLAHEASQQQAYNEMLVSLGIESNDLEIEKEKAKNFEILKQLLIKVKNEKDLLDQTYNYEKKMLEKSLDENSQYNIDKLTYDLKYSKDHESYLTRMFLSEEQIRDKANNIILEKQRQKDLEAIEAEKKARIDKANQGIKAIEDNIKQSEARIADYYLRISELGRTAEEMSVSKQRQTPQEMQIVDTLTLQIENEQKAIELQQENLKQQLEFKKGIGKEEIALQHKIDREKMESQFKTFNTVGQMLKDFGDSSTQALISSGVAAAFAGENIANALKQTLRGLAQEATAKSLLEGAYALGALAMGDEKGASMHGLAALKFGMAAIAVGAMSTLGGAPATGGGASTSTSPTATPQATATEARPEARETQPIVYNINFGGSVIYDTREAAMRAFSNEITQIQSRAVRGTQSARMMNRG